jgi:hypothetical protein
MFGKLSSIDPDSRGSRTSFSNLVVVDRLCRALRAISINSRVQNPTLRRLNLLATTVTRDISEKFDGGESQFLILSE